MRERCRRTYHTELTESPRASAEQERAASQAETDKNIMRREAAAPKKIQKTVEHLYQVIRGRQAFKTKKAQKIVQAPQVKAIGKIVRIPQVM